MIASRIHTLAICTALLAGTLFMRPAQSEETLLSEADTFLKTHSDPSADSLWERDFHHRAIQAMQDNQSISSEERYAVDKALEFFFAKKKHFEESNGNPLSAQDKIEVARWYLLFSHNRWSFPSRIAEHLTKNNYERYVASK